MSSSKGMEKKNKEILVYQRRRKKGTTSGQKASSHENMSVPLGCSFASTDADKVDREIKEDGVVSKMEDQEEEEEQIKVHREIGEDGSYYECDICLEEGDLLCCDTCPRAFHLKCLSLKSVPEGEWQCAKCWFASLSDSSDSKKK